MSVVAVAIHESQFPAQVRRDLLESLRARRMNHKFHYDSIKQTQKWLLLHQAYSPSRNDTDCAAIYDQSFAAAAEAITTPAIHLVGLGCGGGQKDARLIKLLVQSGKQVGYTPSDVSTAMVLVARETALSVISEGDCHPLVCDLADIEDFETAFPKPPQASLPRLVTFFGMIPNFEPEFILPRLGRFVRPGDHLLFSANLAPGTDYEAGLKKILPLYDNELTRDWLLAVLLDLGVQKSDGDSRFVIEADPAGTGLKRVAAYFHFANDRRVQVDDEVFEFKQGESFRLFFSYRHTPDKVKGLLALHGLKVLDQWIAQSEEEGVFLCEKSPS